VYAHRASASSLMQSLYMLPQLRAMAGTSYLHTAQVSTQQCIVCLHSSVVGGGGGCVWYMQHTRAGRDTSCCVQATLGSRTESPCHRACCSPQHAACTCPCMAYVHVLQWLDLFVNAGLTCAAVTASLIDCHAHMYCDDCMDDLQPSVFCRLDGQLHSSLCRNKRNPPPQTPQGCAHCLCQQHAPCPPRPSA
jgi:hypothetical protein